MKVFKLNSTGKGCFVVPMSSGRRGGFTGSHSLSTSGKGLLLSPDLGGFGVGQVEKQVGYVNPPIVSSSFQQKLQALPVKTGLGISKKKKLISLKI